MYESGYSSDEYENEYFFRSEMKSFKSSYEVSSLIMKSANGTIYLGKEKQTTNEVIIKIIPRKSSNLTWLNDRRVPREVKYHLMAAEVDSNTVQILDFFERKKDFIIILEKPDNSIDLLEFINNYGPVNFSTVKSICRQLAISSMSHHYLFLKLCLKFFCSLPPILILPCMNPRPLLPIGCQYKKLQIYL